MNPTHSIATTALNPNPPPKTLLARGLALLPALRAQTLGLRALQAAMACPSPLRAFIPQDMLACAAGVAAQDALQEPQVVIKLTPSDVSVRLRDAVGRKAARTTPSPEGPLSHAAAEPPILQYKPKLGRLSSLMQASPRKQETEGTTALGRLLCALDVPLPLVCGALESGLSHNALEPVLRSMPRECTAEEEEGTADEGAALGAHHVIPCSAVLTPQRRPTTPHTRSRRGLVDTFTPIGTKPPACTPPPAPHRVTLRTELSIRTHISSLGADTILSEAGTTSMTMVAAHAYDPPAA